MSVLAVLDTNIVVSAGIKPGSNPARIVDAALAGMIVPVLCPDIIAEYLDVVNRPHFRRWKFPPRWLQSLITGAHHVDQGLPPWPVPGPDPDDLIFLRLAKHTGAVLVTGNLKDFPERIRLGVEVMDATGYVHHLDGLGLRW